MSASHASAVRRHCRDDGLRDGEPGGAVPEHGRLALVRDADGGELGRLERRRAEGPLNGRLDRPPDLRDVMLDTHPGRGKYCGNSTVAATHRLAVEREDKRRGSGGALVDGEKVGKA